MPTITHNSNSATYPSYITQASILVVDPFGKHTYVTNAAQVPALVAPWSREEVLLKKANGVMTSPLRNRGTGNQWDSYIITFKPWEVASPIHMQKSIAAIQVWAGRSEIHGREGGRCFTMDDMVTDADGVASTRVIINQVPYVSATETRAMAISCVGDRALDLYRLEQVLSNLMLVNNLAGPPAAYIASGNANSAVLSKLDPSAYTREELEAVKPGFADVAMVLYCHSVKNEPALQLPEMVKSYVEGSLTKDDFLKQVASHAPRVLGEKSVQDIYNKSLLDSWKPGLYEVQQTVNQLLDVGQDMLKPASLAAMSQLKWEAMRTLPALCLQSPLPSEEITQAFLRENPAWLLNERTGAIFGDDCMEAIKPGLKAVVEAVRNVGGSANDIKDFLHAGELGSFLDLPELTFDDNPAPSQSAHPVTATTDNMPTQSRGDLLKAQVTHTMASNTVANQVSEWGAGR